MRFDGTIIITDPCYVMRAEHHGTKPITENDWKSCEYGENMEALGFSKNYLTRDTICGDWSCTTYNEFGRKIGEFCADAGLVSVFLLDDVLAYNPDFTKFMKEAKDCVTVIKDFHGDIDIIVNDAEEVDVRGFGNINFYTKQTGV
jgi:hypothetical protein